MLGIASTGPSVTVDTMNGLILGDEFAGFRLLGVLGRGAFGASSPACRDRPKSLDAALTSVRG